MAPTPDGSPPRGGGTRFEGLVFPGFRFGLDDPRDAARLVDLGAGGFCLYGGSAEDVAALTAELQARSREPLLFCADYEDGVASQCSGATRLPSNMGLGASGEERLAVQKAVITGVEAKALGVRWILAPVVDLATEAANPIVNVRAFGADPALVARMARAYLTGLKSEGALGCLKHFPGHGETVADSHLELPALRVGEKTLRERELAPYAQLHARSDSVMIAHLIVEALGDEAGLPASLSAKAMEGLLRRELGYGGLIVTDALSMRAITKHFPEEEAGVRALLAGADVLLVPENPKALIEALPGRVAADPRLAAAAERALGRLAVLRKAAAAGPASPSPDDLSLVGCKAHRNAAQAMAERCLAWAGPVPDPVKAVRYCEPDGDPRDPEGGPFLEALRERGVRVLEAGGREGTPVVGCFVRPHAYSGRIALEPEARERAARALGGDSGGIVVSFGSPFVLADFPGVAGLCAFSGDEHAQRAAARALAGALKPAGKIPVSLTLARA